MKRILLITTTLILSLFLVEGQEQVLEQAQDMITLEEPEDCGCDSEQEWVEEEQSEEMMTAISLMSASYAQDGIIPRIVPVSPQAFVFNRYIDHPVTEYNGLPEISIPLYEITLNGLTIPVELNYHAGGVKYDQFVKRVINGSATEETRVDGDIGAGWSLSVEGYRVSRSINGKPDWAEPIVPEASLEAYSDNSLIGPWQKEKFFGSIYNTKYRSYIFNNTTTYDGEHDIFTYMLPGSSGHFILDESSSPYIIERNLDKIVIGDIHSDYGARGMTITDTNGNAYHMGYTGPGHNDEIAATTSLNYDGLAFPTPGYKIGWPVRRIATPFGEEVSFDYIEYSSYKGPEGIRVTEHNIVTDYHNENFQQVNGRVQPNAFDAGEYKELYTSVIESSHETIIFEREGASHLLTALIVKDRAGRTIREIEFEYYERTSARWHDLLKKVVITNEGAEEEVYLFDYHETWTAARCIVDQWGYYRWLPGVGGFSKVHDGFLDYVVTQRASAGNPHEYDFLPISEASFTADFHNYTTDRSGDNPDASLFSLKKITYPTGGTTEYYYEPNEYPSASSALNRNVKGGGQRIKKIVSKSDAASPPIITEYKYGTNENGLGEANIDIEPSMFQDAHVHVDILEGYCFTNDRMHFTGTVAYSPSKTFFVNPLVPEASDFKVHYPQVAKYQYRTEANVLVAEGKTVSSYDIPSQYELMNFMIRPYLDTGSPHFESATKFLNDAGQAKVVIKNDFRTSPVLLQRDVYDKDANMLLSESYAYTSTQGNRTFKGAKTSQLVSFPGTPIEESSGMSCSGLGNDVFKPHDFIYPIIQNRIYTLHTGRKLLASKQTTTYSGADSFTVEETYSYDDLNRLSSKAQSTSLDDILTTKYTYADNTYSGLVAHNMRETVIGKSAFIGNFPIDSIKYNYSPESIRPESVATSVGGNPLRTEASFQYDSRGNIIEVTTADGVNTAYIWGYNYKYPVAEIKGCTYDRIEEIMSSFTLDDIAGSAELSQNQTNLLNALRSALSGALVTVFEYRPLIGVTKITDPTGRTTEYVYDGLGRLAEIKDEDENLIHTYLYNFSNKSE